jgi:integrase
MARRRNGTPPSYCLHKQSGQAVFNWPLGGGKYKAILLGKHGTAESHTAYQRVLAEWRAAQGSPAPALKTPNGQPADLTLYEIALQFDKHAERYYRNPTTGEPTGEADNFKDALQPMLGLYGHCSWREFGPLALRAVRVEMVRAGLARKTINARTNRIRRFFRWAASLQIVPESVVVALETVPPFRKGEQVEIKTDSGEQVVTVRESPGVHDIEWERVETVLPHLPRPVAAMVQIMRYSNCRAEDVVIMRTCDLDRGNDPWWEYRPESHKNQWREESSEIHKRLVYLGRRCQELLQPFLKSDQPEAYLFSPREAKAAFQAERAARRTTKRTPSELRRKRRTSPQRAPRARYDVNTFQQSIRRACLKLGVPVWKLLEVRHTRATDVREQYGIEGASASLGNTVEAAQIYAEKNRALARRIAVEMG